VNAIIRKLYDSRFMRFAFVGGTGVFVNEAVLALAHELAHIGPRYGDPARPSAAMPTSASAMLVSTSIFVRSLPITNSVGAAANYIVYVLLIGNAPYPLNIPYLALAVGILVGLVFNFTLSKKLVFRPRT